MMGNNEGCDAAQLAICSEHGSRYFESAPSSKVGISQSALNGDLPLHGLRHLSKGDTTGWYIWAGEYSADPDFFSPLHVEHLSEICPRVVKFLGLAPGWRFLLGDANHEDVWYDPSLVHE